jgi:glycosyltransferase involved in cell wall biosynthesis
MIIKVLEILPTLDYCGGAEAYVMNYYFHIVQDTEVHIDFLIHGTPKKDNYISQVESKGSKVYILPDFSIKTFSKISKMFKDILANEKYDIIHDHMANSAFLYFKIAKRMGVSHRILHSHQSKAADTWTHALRNRPLLALGKRLSTDYMACSKKAGDYLFPRKQYFILNNAVETERFAFSTDYRNAIRSELHIPEDAKVIGHIGRFCAQKNQGFLIDAFKQILNNGEKYFLILVGDGPDLESMKKKVAENGLSDFVFFTGATKEAYKYYSAFDVLCLPSLYEGIPTVGIEATYSGLPVLASNRITTELNFGNNITFMPLKDSRAWARQLEKLANPSQSREPSHSGDFDIQVQASHLLDYYKQLAA